MYLSDSVRDLIQAAANAAPSADNSKPWRMLWFDNRLDLWIDKHRSGEFSDKNYLLSDLALGACIENIRIQGNALGFATDIQLFPEPVVAPLWVARIQWRVSEIHDQVLAGAIPHRHTDRSFPWDRGGGAIDAARLHLESIEIGLGNAHILNLSEGNKRSSALRVLRRAESMRFASKMLHSELFRAIRFDVGWVTECDLGIPPRALGVERPLRPLFKMLRYWPVMRCLNMFGADRLMGARAADLPTRFSPLLYLLTVESMQRDHIIDAGRLMERYWLSATLSGLSVQPFAAVGAILYGGGALESHMQTRRVALAEEAEALCGGKCGLMFMRMGLPR